MPATSLPQAHELDWLEHFSFSSEGGATDGARGVGLSSSVSRAPGPMPLLPGARNQSRTYTRQQRI
jgi:hypothetical protein